MNFLNSIMYFPVIFAVLASLYLLALTIAAVWPRRRAILKNAQAGIAVIIPAHNEETGIRATIKSALDQDYPAALYEVIVVADNCSDGTTSEAQRAGARVIERNNPDLRGKGYALQYVFEQLRPERFDAYFIVDADSLLSRNALAETSSLLGDGAQAVQLFDRVANPDDSWRTMVNHAAITAFNLVRPQGRTHLGLSCGLNGNGFAVTKDLVERIPYTAHSIVEDLEYAVLLAESGERVVFSGRAFVAALQPAKQKAATMQRTRWQNGRLKMMALLIPGLAKRVLAGKLRLIDPLMDLLTPPLSIFAAIVLSIMAIPVPFCRIAGIFCLAVLSIHVFTGLIITRSPLKYYAALVFAPLYIVWMMMVYARIFFSNKASSRWNRTPREQIGRTFAE